jgi:hypothetical protein
VKNASTGAFRKKRQFGKIFAYSIYDSHGGHGLNKRLNYEKISTGFRYVELRNILLILLMLYRKKMSYEKVK